MTNRYNQGHKQITVNRWIGILLLLTIPAVNLCFVIYWAFIQKVSTTLRNFARAIILWFIIILLILTLTIMIIAPDFQNFVTAWEDLFRISHADEAFNGF